MQRSVANAYQRENHRHFNCDSENAQDRTDRSMGEFGRNKFIEQDQIIVNRSCRDDSIPHQPPLRELTDSSYFPNR